MDPQKLEAVKQSRKKYYEKKKQNEDFLNNMNERRSKWVAEHKNTEEYKQKTRENARQYYEKNKQRVLDRMKKYHDSKREHLSIDILLPNII